MNEQLTVKYIKTKNKVRKIVTYKENGELRRYHEEVVKYLEKYVTNSIFATVYKGNIIKNLIMDCQSYTKYRPNETMGGIFVSWRRKEELPTGA